ncbi:MAG: hypothetical protein A3J62_03450 [Candidatus Buchananbacteria bacterium RIFCSPHIGHO2_02_FULL_38_8]|uniref:Rrf2 family transcriptional regulator n=2 Tax=Candidatus Buchananiibacteriota TaxID=1817903 RepID=A0A1G1XSS9_9BACT|nr:MAG: hypothetical protein A2731_03540 [Candidatus Buchananbacteria bacterium RIFCSPHIGHO2_01_FULL_39_8]OGY47219.1 MAG: hypothetical protein A3J62_03450 [Candidatus Buchananbacteria bacterium RIFCSPHIGHO2_02_FULL_38_8]
MRFSSKTEYGMRAMVELAKRYGNGLTSLADIARREKISQPYLERLVAKLREDGLVEGTKGVKGGYRLTKKPASISLFEIIEALEGPIVIFHCLADNTKIVCTHRSCLTKKVWFKIQDEIVSVLRTTKLSDIV